MARDAKAFLGEPGIESHNVPHPLPPISTPEHIGAAILIGASLTIGLYPQLLLNQIIPALSSPLFDGMWKGSWR